MSGHSKWATTKRQKAVVDAKRGALFTKIGNQIAIAARAGTDPAMNPSLAMVLEKARLANMPKANIERAIARVADKSAAALIEETYEAYGPGGVGIIIEVATDNKNRTMPEVRHTLEKNGGRMADPGSVMFQFARKGVIFVPQKNDELTMSALEAGAEDISEETDGTTIYTAAGDLAKVRSGLIDAGYTIESAELQYVATTNVPVDEVRKQGADKVIAVKFDEDNFGKDSNVMDIIMRTIDIMGNKIIEEEIKKSDYVLNIHTGKMGLLETSKIYHCFEYGYEAAKNSIEEIKRCLN